jgi:hypothetical protein
MGSMESLSALICTRPSTDVAAAAVPVAGVGSVLLAKKWSRRPGTERIAVAFEPDLVVVAVTPRPALRFVARGDRAPTASGHVGTGSFDDLPNPFSCEPERGSDAGQGFSSFIAK